MFQAIKRLFGAGEDAKAARAQAAEEERREREQRIQAQKEALAKSTESKQE